MFRIIKESEYRFVESGPDFSVPDKVKHAFRNNGFVIVRDVFSQAEVEKIMTSLKSSKEFLSNRFDLSDKDKRRYDAIQWTDTEGRDVVGMAGRLPKTALLAQELLGKGELYLYSEKTVMKEAGAGRILWHQDYGYWYNNRCLFPDFVTCCIALTKSDRENGGLQVMKKSHLCGRVEHNRTAGQTAADVERAEMLEKELEVCYCDLKPGDICFFHANTLHQSPPNDSNHPRWHLIFSYNARHNSPDLPHYNALYSPLQLHPMDAIRKCEDLTVRPKTYVDPKANKNISTET